MSRVLLGRRIKVKMDNYLRGTSESCYSETVLDVDSRQETGADNQIQMEPRVHQLAMAGRACQF